MFLCLRWGRGPEKGIEDGAPPPRGLTPKKYQFLGTPPMPMAQGFQAIRPKFRHPPARNKITHLRSSDRQSMKYVLVGTRRPKAAVRFSILTGKTLDRGLGLGVEQVKP